LPLFGIDILDAVDAAALGIDVVWPARVSSSFSE
jgi:hypothetical protein